MSQVTGKAIEVLFENAIESFEEQDQMLGLVNQTTPDQDALQKSGNVIWKSAKQRANVVDGWDVTGLESGIIKETYPCILGTPKNDLVHQRADEIRSMEFWKERGKESGRQQVSTLNKAITDAMVTQGSMFYRNNSGSGYNFVAEAQALMNERQQPSGATRNFLLNDRDNLTFSAELAGRQTLQGRPEGDAWSKGQIGSNIAGFDIYTGSFLPTIAGGADPATTVTADQSFAPEGGTVNTTTGVVTNVDYRSATIPVTASGSYAVGDKVTFANGGTTVKAIGKGDFTVTDTAMTFTIVDIPDGTSITVYPKPIAADDPGLTSHEQKYANINTRILNTATVNRVNTDALKRANLFWNKDAVEVTTGAIPAELMKQFGGMQVVSSTMKNGQTMYMFYDGNIETMNFTCRLFTWYGITIGDPSQVGAAVTF